MSSLTKKVKEGKNELEIAKFGEDIVVLIYSLREGDRCKLVGTKNFLTKQSRETEEYQKYLNLWEGAQ